VDIGKSFGYVFEDDKWVTKVLIGGLVSLIPIVNLAVIGYALRTLKNVAEGQERPLPEWDDFGTFFVKGLLAVVAVLIYSIPVILLSALGGIISGIASSGGQDVSGAAGLCVASLSCLSVLYAIVLALWLPATAVEYAMAGDFGAFFRFGEAWGLISHNLGGYIVALVIAWLASMIAGLVGAVLCLVGTLFTSFWATLVAVHLLGQLRRETIVAPPAVPIEPTRPDAAL